METIIKKALERGSGKNGINFKVAREYLKMVSGARYQLYSLAGSCGWAYNSTGIIQYRGRKYYYRQNGENMPIILERA